jgi:uncharacterized protein YjiS (DUF1127 family)
LRASRARTPRGTHDAQNRSANALKFIGRAMQFLHGRNSPENIVQAQHLPHLQGNQGNSARTRQRSMAHATDYATRAQSALNARWETLLSDIRARRARRRVFRSTHSELSALSDRELADLGLARSEIGRIAYQAAYET